VGVEDLIHERVRLFVVFAPDMGDVAVRETAQERLRFRV
jgi:hypothetical protein